MFKKLEVKNYMMDKPATVKPDASVYEAAHLILVNKISGVCVVDEGNKLVGMLSELDCLRSIMNSAYNDDEPASNLVSDVMTREVECCHPDDDVVNVAMSMLDHKHRRRPVVADGKLVGQVTCRQLLRMVKDFAGHMSDAREG